MAKGPLPSLKRHEHIGMFELVPRALEEEGGSSAKRG
jgi:hypothetical protein